MIEHVYRRAQSCAAVARVIVATDDLRIADAVRRFGGDVRLTRDDHATGTDRIAEVAATLDAICLPRTRGERGPPRPHQRPMPRQQNPDPFSC